MSYPGGELAVPIEFFFKVDDETDAFFFSGEGFQDVSCGFCSEVFLRCGGGVKGVVEFVGVCYFEFNYCLPVFPFKSASVLHIFPTIMCGELV